MPHAREDRSTFTRLIGRVLCLSHNARKVAYREIPSNNRSVEISQSTKWTNVTDVPDKYRAPLSIETYKLCFPAECLITVTPSPIRPFND